MKLARTAAVGLGVCLAVWMAMPDQRALAGPLPNLGPVPFPFHGLREYPVGADPRYSAAADLDGDGWLDVAVTLRTDSAVRVMLNRGDGGLLPGTLYTVGNYPLDVFAKDVNGDGNVDLVVHNSFDLRASLLIGNGDGTLTINE